MNDQMSLNTCWEYHLQIWGDQTSVVGSENDKKILYGLERFPRLKRVTVTPAAHGWLFSPLYETPMIRAFPYGFNYLIPQRWYCHYVELRSPEPLPGSEAAEDYREFWSGSIGSASFVIG